MALTLAAALLAACEGDPVEPPPGHRPDPIEPTEPRITGYLMIAVYGQGAVQSNDAARGIDCGKKCMATYPIGTKVTLWPAPAEGWVFDRWDGDLDCVDGRVTIELMRRCTARFVPVLQPHHSVEIVIEGSGSVHFPNFQNKPGCDESCIRGFPAMTEVEVQAIPRFGWKFSEITGDDDCRDGRVTTDAYKRCVINFGLDADAQRMLRIDFDGMGSVMVQGPYPVDECKHDCVRGFPAGSYLTLNAIGHQGRGTFFLEFTGDEGCADARISMERDTHCVVHFSEGRQVLWMSTSEGGRVRVEPLGAECRSADGDEPCRYPLRTGDRAEIIAIPDEGAELDRWLGDCDGQTVLMNEDKSCKALFRPRKPPCAAGSDLTPPSPPREVRAEPAGGCVGVLVSWPPAVDGNGCGIGGYRVFRDGRLLATLPQHALSIEDTPWIRGGAAHRYSVIAVDAAGNLSRPSTEARVVLPACEPPPDDMRVNVVMVRFPELGVVPFTRDDAERTMFGPRGSVNEYLLENSHGATRVLGNVYGWYVLPEAMAAYCTGRDENDAGTGCDYYKIRADTVRAADADVDFGAAYRTVLVYHRVADWGGLAGAFVDTDEGPVQPLAEIANFTLHTLVHELGHTFNRALHAGSWVCEPQSVGADHADPLAGGCHVATYGDPLDPMGAGINHFSAEHKMRMGWLAPDRIQEIGGDGIYEIGALELWTQGPKAIALPLDPGAGMAGDRYVFEYRVPEGWDMLTRSGERLKAVVARAGVTFPTTQSADTLIPEDTWRLTPGTVFYDRWRGLTVEVLEMTEGSATVRVRGTGR